jgi:hypothetical protein
MAGNNVCQSASWAGYAGVCPAVVDWFGAGATRSDPDVSL